ncbi:MFS transporter [Metallibacterium sp.]|jgi:predicted MFS family arabinose efflux permease|uniref:MFS transporter n=1 Tax=Metallibacterium sp. TaxID=2940281 RepID=UPI002606E3AA|nr:MFS transporter [Metallibacterium sp.]
MTKMEIRSALALALVVGLRMFGLFLVLPVLALDLQRMPGVTPLLIGAALGIYGVGHLLLQIPLGLLSDHIGRKPVITLGLALFALGSLIAALAHGVDGIILGRALQGTGAVTGASQALAADLSGEHSRNAVMGILGGTIGLAFLLALLLGSTLAAHLGGLQGLFGLTFVLVLVAIAALWLLVPHAPAPRTHGSEGLGAIVHTLRDTRLLVLDVSAFVLHGLLTLFFVVMPLLLAHGLHLVAGAQWRVYVPALLTAGLVMGVALPRMRGLRASIRALQFSALLLALGLAALAFARGSLGMGMLGAVLFFVAFSMLEASLPSLVSRLAQPARRGAALGAYSAAQFFGVIVGGACGGVLLGTIGVAGGFATAAIVALLWFLMLLPAGARLGQPAPAGARGAG